MQITPYAEQKALIQAKWSKNLYPDLKIGSVEEFQGLERNVILLSTVRSNLTDLKTDKEYCLGFIHDPKRINVAISRAKTLLIVFGREDLLRTNHNWDNIIKHTIKNKTYNDGISTGEN